MVFLQRTLLSQDALSATEMTRISCDDFIGLANAPDSLGRLCTPTHRRHLWSSVSLQLQLAHKRNHRVEQRYVLRFDFHFQMGHATHIDNLGPNWLLPKFLSTNSVSDHLRAPEFCG